MLCEKNEVGTEYKIQKQSFCSSNSYELKGINLIYKFKFVLFAFIFFIVCINFVSAELNYTTGEAVYGVMADGSTTNFLNLTIQVRSCDDSACSGESWSSYYTNATYNNISSLSNNTYFQYKAIFTTENQNYTPYLFNVTIDYTYLDTTYPLIDYASPTPSNNSGTSLEFQINLSITEENPANMSYNWNGTNTTIPILDSLILMFNFDNISALNENDTHVADASRYSNNGTVMGATWNSSGKYNGAFEFDGIEDSITVNQRIQCPEGMVYINKLNGFCIDKYEASVWNADGTWNSTSNTSTWNAAADTDQALSANAYANSSEGVYPWVYIDQTEARTACANYPGGNKYLCTDEQWLAAANIKGEYFNLAATLTDCTIDETRDCDWADSPGGGDACMTGSKTDCVSSEGVYDMTGNVWEWTNETVGYTKPCNTGSSGWCYWNGTGFQTGTDANTAVYGNDGVYFLSGTRTGYAVRRGGCWDGGASAGPFCAALTVAPTATYAHVGFRCCSS